MCVYVCVSFRRYTRRRLWSDWDQIWHIHADSSPNGSVLNKNQLHVTQGGLGGGLGGQKFKNLEYLPNGWTNWLQIWYTPADSSGNGHRRKTICLSTPGGILGGFRGSEIQKSGITTKRVAQLAQNLVHACGFIWEWTSRLKTISPSIPQGAGPL